MLALTRNLRLVLQHKQVTENRKKKKNNKKRKTKSNVYQLMFDLRTGKSHAILDGDKQIDDTFFPSRSERDTEGGKIIVTGPAVPPLGVNLPYSTKLSATNVPRERNLRKMFCDRVGCDKIYRTVTYRVK